MRKFYLCLIVLTIGELMNGIYKVTDYHLVGHLGNLIVFIGLIMLIGCPVGEKDNKNKKSSDSPAWGSAQYILFYYLFARMFTRGISDSSAEYAGVIRIIWMLYAMTNMIMIEYLAYKLNGLEQATTAHITSGEPVSVPDNSKNSHSLGRCVIMKKLRKAFFSIMIALSCILAALIGIMITDGPDGRDYWLLACWAIFEVIHVLMLLFLKKKVKNLENTSAAYDEQAKTEDEPLS